MNFKRVYVVQSQRAGKYQIDYVGQGLKAALKHCQYVDENPPRDVQDFERLTFYMLPPSVMERIDEPRQLFDENGKAKFNMVVQWTLYFYPS